MIRLIAAAGFALAVATSSQAITPAPISQPDGMINISCRSGEAGHEPGAHGIADRDRDNGNRGGGLLGRGACRVARPLGVSHAMERWCHALAKERINLLRWSGHSATARQRQTRQASTGDWASKPAHAATATYAWQQSRSRQPSSRQIDRRGF